MNDLKYPEVPEHILADTGALFVWLLMLGESQGDIGMRLDNPRLSNRTVIYIAQDSDGEWYGYRDKPYLPCRDILVSPQVESWNGSTSKFLARTAPLLRWKESLREVPHETT